MPAILGARPALRRPHSPTRRRIKRWQQRWQNGDPRCTIDQGQSARQLPDQFSITPAEGGALAEPHQLLGTYSAPAFALLKK